MNRISLDCYIHSLKQRVKECQTYSWGSSYALQMRIESLENLINDYTNELKQINSREYIQN